MARQSPGRRNAEEHAADNLADPAEEVDAVEAIDDEDVSGTADASPAGIAAQDDDPDEVDESADEDRDAAAAGAAADQPVWSEVRIDPVEVALPAGTGYTLRAYRLASTLTPTEVGERDEDDPFAQRVRRSPLDDDETVVLDDEFDELTDDDLPETGRHRIHPDEVTVPDGDAGDIRAEDEREDSRDKESEDELEEEETAQDAEATAEDEAEETKEDEEVPVFLSHQGKLLLFRSAESLVTFIRSGAPNDLAQVDTWARLAERIELADVVVGEEDTYELDLVVENLRGGHDAWDVNLLIKAGELARDLGYALRLEPVVTALSADSPLDDLDEALRKTADGGLGSFLGRRRLRKIGAQQATLGWRTIIGKISGAVDWRD